MKTRSQKLISLVLVLMMLATMIPMGIFSANAAVSAELSAGLADIDNTAEFVINNVDDWKAVAATNNQFVGKTIKLGADIDAQGETLPQLFMFGNARCTFDGQGYTIKNVGTAEAPLSAALFSAKSNLNIQNLTVQNVHVKGEGVKGVIVDWQNCWAKYTFKNIKVLDSSVVSTNSAAGVIIGEISGNAGNYGVDFENILVSGCSAEGTSTGGGWNPTGVAALAGYSVFNSGDYGATAKNIEVVNTTITDNAAASCAAGLFGYFRHHAGTILSVENCYVNATFKTPASSGWTGVDTALFQITNSSVANNNIVTMKNCLTNCTFSGIVQSTSLCYASQAIFVAENLWAVTNPGKSGMLINSGNTVNGTSAVASNYNAIQAATIAVDAVATYITRDANGFVSAIAKPDKINGITAELYDALANPAGATEFVIKSAADWTAVSQAPLSTFVNKTIKLGADIDAEGATLPTLQTFDRMVFDGCDYTIKNAKATNALFSTYFAPKSTIRNVKLDNIEVTGTNRVGLLISHASLQTDLGASAIENIIATNITINATGATATGGLIGNIALGTQYLTIKNVSITGSVTADNGNVGGVVGALANNVEGFKLEGAYVDVDITNNAPTGDDYANATGGAIGYAGFSGTSATLPIKDVYFCGNLKTSQTAAGIIGYCVAGGRTITMDNVAVNGTYELPGWTRAGFVNFRGEGYFNYTNLYINTGGWAGGPLKWYCLDISGGIKVNGAATAIAQTHLYNNYRDVINTLMDEPKIDLSKVVKVDGYKVTVVDHVYATAIQESTNNDGDTYAVRFIAAAQLINIESAKMNIVATYVENGVEVKRAFTADCTLYDKLTVYGEYGIEKTADAADFNACKLAALTIYGIPTGAEITFEVTTTYVTVSGQTVAGAHPMTVTFDANGALVK